MYPMYDDDDNDDDDDDDDDELHVSHKKSTKAKTDKPSPSLTSFVLIPYRFHAKTLLYLVKFLT